MVPKVPQRLTVALAMKSACRALCLPFRSWVVALIVIK